MVYGAAEPTLGSFAARRFLKIFPSYALAVLATVPFALPFIHSQAELWRALAVHAAFIHNFYADVFGKRTPSFGASPSRCSFT